MCFRNRRAKGANTGAHFYGAAHTGFFAGAKEPVAIVPVNAALTVPASDEKIRNRVEQNPTSGVRCLMMTRSDSLMRLLAAATLIGAAALMLTPVSARTSVQEFPSIQGSIAQPDPEPEDMFADAEFGVDPMVTGPTTREFRATQARLGCLEAKWPDIPAACYPSQN